MTKFRRLTKGDIATISGAIADPECRTLAEAAQRVGMDPSGIRRAIVRLRSIAHTKLRNRCGLCRKCRVKSLCRDCPGGGARAFLNEKVLGLNEYRSMPRDKVNPAPGLVK